MGSNDKRLATEVDPWERDRSETVRKATEVDPGFKRPIGDASNSAGTIGSAVANHFATLAELRSSSGNVYQVERTISKSGGEAIILLCTDAGGNKVAAKVYYEPVNKEGFNISSRTRVLEYMKTEEGRKYTLAITETGRISFGDSEYYFEVMPYCENLDISDKGAFSFDQLEEITRQLNQALHSIHQAGIIHMDIKPENIYEVEGQYKLGDFGIAKTGAQGQPLVTEHMYGTEGYAAPETSRYVYSEKSDYYSLGITLATLFEGHYVFENMEYRNVALSQESERLPLRRQDPRRELLENLLDGLCKINRNQRFGYVDVEFWLADHNYTGGGAEEEWSPPYRILDEICYNEMSMFYAITQDRKYWDEALKHLYGRLLEPILRNVRTDLTSLAQSIDEEYHAANRDKGLYIFLKKLYPPGPIVWKGDTFKSLSELGEKMLETPSVYIELLQNRCVSYWLNNTEGISPDEETARLVNSIEALSATEPELASYWFGYSFVPNGKLEICERSVSTIDEMIKALFETPIDFYQLDGFEKLTDKKKGAGLYGFLYSLGYKEIVEKAWKKLGSFDTFIKMTILTSMLDDIAERSNADTMLIRKFFINYGPVGLAAYTKRLVEEGVYKALDADGKKVLDEFMSFKTPPLGSVNEMFRAYSSLIDSVEKMRCILIDNPHCILTGVYESKGVICTDLVGCFAFKIFDRKAPVGFCAWIEDSKGGAKY